MRVNMSIIKQKGFSLIELLVAMLIGSIVLLGVISLFSTTSELNRTQSGLSVLQENGRYAITRIKSDIENAGRRHCASIAMPTGGVNSWVQGYTTTAWEISNSATINNGFPSKNYIAGNGLDTLNDGDQLPEPVALDPNSSYPIDSSYFIRGHECSGGSCVPDLSTPNLGTDALTAFPSIGTGDGDRSGAGDVLTVRYLTGGSRVSLIQANNAVPPTYRFSLIDAPAVTTGDAIIADCQSVYVSAVNWGSMDVSVTGEGIPTFTAESGTRVFNMDTDLRNVSYFVGIDQDPSDASRRISSLYRSENGNVQQLVEGVERFDIFYLVQLQTGHVIRMTADEMDSIEGGGDTTGNGEVDTMYGCIKPPESKFMPNAAIANSPGCLWRSVYAIEVHLLMNTVNNSSISETERYIYTVDGPNVQSPPATLPSGLPRDRMHRKEFTAIVPVRSYTL